MSPSPIKYSNWLPAAGESGTFQIVIDYPHADAILSPNRRLISGWCWSRNGPVDSIRLSIDSREEVRGRWGYPRLDAVEHGIPICAGENEQRNVIILSQ